MTSPIFDKLALYWAYPFVRHALIVGVLIALCSSLLGVTLVLKRFSFIGDGLSHVAFGAMSIAAVLGMTDDIPLTLGITVFCAILLLRSGQNVKIKGDASIAMISVGALAVGYLLMNLFFHIGQLVWRCMQYTFWFYFYSDTDTNGGLVMRRTFCYCSGRFLSALQQNFCSDI